jgi:hypothetical protein
MKRRDKIRIKIKIKKKTKTEVLPILLLNKLGLVG